MSLLGSIVNIGGLIATPLCGYAVDKIGRKYSAMLFGLPFVISWALIAATTSFYTVLFAVGLSGFGAAGQAVSTVYISEIAQDSIRGALTSSTVYGFFFGLLMSYTFGGYMSYYSVLYTHLALSVLYILMLIPLKESPCYLLMLEKEKEAAESIAFYQRVDVSSKEVELEIQKIKLQLGSKEDKILKSDADTQEAEDLLKKTSVESNEKKETAWQFLKRSRSSQRALIAVFTVMSLTILMGSIVLQVYAEPLFKEAVPTMHPNTCSILMAVTYLTAALLCASMLDKFGRKALLTVTSILTGISNIILGTQLNLHWAPHWFTAFIIYGSSFVYNLGAAIVPFVLTAEVFLPQVRGLGNSVAMATMWIMNWVTLIIFNPIVEWWGLGSAFYFFSFMCFLSAAYGQFCLPETKGLSADEIQLLFLKEKRNDTQKV
ncbi:sugar transporter [Danaus plexippus plexippus]|uniref:Sugar transporter n=1 Tax=Danaus plexippus plexippus TaxID=278856 RepID=A0A212F787_DANPL|nr:sugar transporter [Danaus plexippus plexippus]